MRLAALTVLLLASCYGTQDGVDLDKLCQRPPLSCGITQFVLTWGCHHPPSESPTTRSCQRLPAACESDFTCACVKANYDAGVNCSPSQGPACSTDGGELELYCNPP